MIRRVAVGLAGHAYTIGPLLRHALRPTPIEGASLRAAPWSVEVDGGLRGRVRLTGRLHDVGGDGLVVLVHGLGGHDASHYVLTAAGALAEVGLSSLRIALRGADRRGDDFYHAGLSEDLVAVLASPAVRRFRKVFLWGSSLGGHLSLRTAAVHPEARLAGVVAVCPPIDLARGAAAIDALPRRPYLRHVLGGLVTAYAEVAARGPVPLPVAAARRIRSIRAWDEAIVARRFGFHGADDYYRRASVAPHLSAIAVPTLVVVGDADPMVPAETVWPALGRASSAVDARRVPGGHVGFPGDLHLGQRGASGLEAQIVRWITDRL